MGVGQGGYLLALTGSNGIASPDPEGERFNAHPSRTTLNLDTQGHPLTTYHPMTQTSTGHARPWWLALVEEPTGLGNALVEGLVGSLSHEVRKAGPAMERAMLHVINSIGRLAKTRSARGWPQVSVSYVVEGADVGHKTARTALQVLCRALLCTRTRRGFLTVSPEGRAACLRATDRLGAPMPAVHREDWSGRTVEIVTLKKRGVTHCPCGEHANGDKHPSLAYDMSRGLATCQKTRAVFRLTDNQWMEVRKPYADCALPPGSFLGGDNTYPQGGATPQPWSPRPAWGRHLTGTLHPGDLRRNEAGTRGRARSLSSIMKWSDSYYGGVTEGDKAHTCAALGSTRPERLVSLDRWILDRDATRWQKRSNGTSFPAHKVYKSTGTELVVFDLDGLSPAGTAPDLDAVDRIRRALTGSDFTPVSVVATSRTGVQVVARVPGWCPDTSRLHLHLGVRRSLVTSASALLAALGRGGAVDRACWSAGRYIRRPGWRVKAGEAVRARLWWSEE